MTYPPGFSGNVQWVQTYTIFHRLKMPDDSWVKVTGSGLDRTYPYTYLNYLNDIPSQPLSGETVEMNVVDFKEAQIADAAQSYLMFKSDETDSIWVPLKQINWLWTAEAFQQPDGSYAIGDTNAPAPITITNYNFPVWTNNIHPLMYVPE